MDDHIDLVACERLAAVPKSNPDALDSLLRGDAVVSPHPPVQLGRGAVDWDLDPFDRNWRHSFHSLRWLDPALWGMSQGMPEATTMWVHTVQDWVAHNPTSVSEERPQAWANMIDGIRALRMVAAAPWLGRHAAEELRWLVPALRQHMLWMADEANLGHSNHALHQHEALYTVATVLGDEGLVRLARTRLSGLFSEHWSTDGINAEGAIAYHHMNYLWWSRVVELLNAAGDEGVEDFVAVLDQVPRNLAHATRPDGFFVSIGDTDGGRPTRVNHPTTEWVTTGGAKGEPPEENILVHPDGYVFGRSGWGAFERDFASETFFSLTFGRYKVHGHEDGGSLTYSAGGVNWIVDPGKFSYSHETAIRQHMVAHNSHSLTYLKGKDRSRNVPVALAKSALDGGTYDFEFLDNGYEGAEISRRVVYSTSGEYLVVIDTVRADEELTAVQRWQLGPGVKANINSLTVNLVNGDAQAQLRFFGIRPEVEVQQHDGVYPNGLVATGWKQCAEAAVVEAFRTGKSLRFVTVLAPRHGKSDVQITAQRDLAPGQLAFLVDTGRAREMVLITRTDSKILPADVSLERIVQANRRPTPRREAPGSLDPDLRQAAHEAATSARRDAWDLGVKAAREQWTPELLQLKTELGEVDLGLGATLADLGYTSGAIEGATRGPLINWNGSKDWAPTAYRFPVVSHRGVLNPALVERQRTLVHTVDLGELTLSGLHIPGKEPVLTVLFHGAVDRAKTRLPLFLRLAGHQKLGVGHTLILSDPTLDLARHMRLSWFLGTERLNLHGAIAEWLKQWMAALEISDLVASGSSGGGLAALQVGIHLPSSLVIPFSPQTDTREYLAPTQREAYGAVFGSPTAPTSSEDVARISVAAHAEAAGRFPKVIYVQNAKDEMHVKRHAQPLMAQMEQRGFGSQIEYRSLDLGAGHRSLAAEDYDALMREIYRGLGHA